MALIQLERFDEAFAYSKNALASFPEEVQYLYFQAFILFKQNRSKEALGVVQTLLAKEPNHDVYHHLHAQVLVELERYVEAKRAIDTALSLDAHDADFLVTLAIITYHLGNTPIACDIVTSILEKEPHHAGA